MYVALTVPEATPVTTPEEVTVATVASLPDQLPPDGVADNVIELPTQTSVTVEVTAGAAYTVKVAVASQPVV
jgi:hypothetical protein